jgi:ATP-binding cassette, subfamily B, bacterial MsbA
MVQDAAAGFSSRQADFAVTASHANLDASIDAVEPRIALDLPSVFRHNPAGQTPSHLLFNPLNSSNFDGMNSILRLLIEARRYWRSLLLATLCSFAVAALWGANIGAFYPILEVTIRGKSVEQWFDEQMSHLQARLVENQETQSELMRQLSASPDSADRARAEVHLRQARADQQDLSRRLEAYQRALPHAQRWIPQDPFGTIVMIVGILLLSTLVKHAFMIVNDYLVGRAAVDLSREMRQKLFSKALHLDRAAFSKQGASSFQGQITHTTDLICTGLIATFGAAIREPMKLLACLIGAAIICPRLLLLSLLIAPILGWILYSITRSIRRNTRRMLSRIMSFHGVMLESLANIQTVQAYQMEDHEDTRFSESTWTTRKYRLRCLLLASMTKPVIEFLGVGMLGMTIISGAYLVLNQETQLLGITICSEPLSVSALLVFFGMLIGASDPLRRMSAVYWQIYSGIVASESLYSVLDQPIAISDPECPRQPPDRHQSLTLKEVSFGYDPNHLILKGVSLEIPFGSTVAIVGQNGSGKSTLIQLLCRFFDPQEGSLLLDGIDYRQMRVADVRSKIAIVNQQAELFNDTVSYNIRYGSLTATDEQVRLAAQSAQAAEFIENSLPCGYLTEVGTNGHRLSGGQRQRIALARALLRNPEILILDEATSQIDMQSEQMIRQSLAAHRGKRTMIIITHREKLLELADIVWEVRNGQLLKREPEAVASAMAGHRDVA